MNKKNQLSVVIPVKNEEKNIPILIQRIENTLSSAGLAYEVIFVTDINRDNTYNILKMYCEKHQELKMLKLSNSFGHHNAILAGLFHAAGDYIVIMDGDLQDYPEDIEILYNKCIEGYDLVYAVKDNKNSHFFRNVFSRLFNMIIKKLSDNYIEANSSMFRIISRRLLNEICQFKESDLSLTYLMAYINLPSAQVQVNSGKRMGGKSNFSFTRQLNFAITSLLAFSTKPLRMISVFGLFISFISFIYLIMVVLQKYLLSIEVSGWATIVVILCFLGGIQLFVTGVVGEYIGKIYMQTKNRPRYIIEEKTGSFYKEHQSV